MSSNRAKTPCPNLLARRRNGTLYIGVTSDLHARIGLHKQDLIEGFTKKYGVHTLVYYEMHESMPAAILREKQLKEWRRAWKIRLIESMNSEWIDLFDERTGAILDGPADVEHGGCWRKQIETWPGSRPGPSLGLPAKLGAGMTEVILARVWHPRSCKRRHKGAKPSKLPHTSTPTPQRP